MHFTDQEEAAMCGMYPSVYARICLGHTPYPWQAEVMDWMAPKRARGLACTCNESGKTSHLVRDLILWHMDTEPGSLTVTTAGVNRQIGEQLYPYLDEACKSLPGWKVSRGNKYRVEAPNGSRCVSFATDDANLAEGFHKPDRGSSLWSEWSPPEDWDIGIELNDDTSFLLIVDEAKSVDTSIFRAIQRMNPPRLLICSSAPEAPTGFFVECFTNRKEWFLNEGMDPEDPNSYNIVGGTEEFPNTSYRNCPHLWNDPKYVADAILEKQQFGEKSAFYVSMYEGRIPEEGSNMLFRMSRVDMGMSGMIRQWGYGTRRAAIDFSNGGDEIPIYIAEGNRVELVMTLHESDAPTLATLVIGCLKSHGLRPRDVVGDNTSMGDPIIDIMRKRGWDIGRIDFNQAAMDKQKFANVRAELLWNLAVRINCGELMLEKDAQLRKECSWHTYTVDENGRIKIISKEKMPASPNRVDTLAMLFYNQPRAQAFVDEEISQNRALSPTLPDKPRIGYETQTIYGHDEEDEDPGGLFY